MRISVDGSRIHNNKVAFSNLSGIVWTGPNTHKKIHENGTFWKLSRVEQFENDTFLY